MDDLRRLYDQHIRPTVDWIHAKYREYVEPAQDPIAAGVALVFVVVFYYLFLRSAPAPAPRDNYDLDIAIPPFYDLLKAKAINFTSRIDLETDLSMRIVGIIGIKNRGKSWLLGKLFSESLPEKVTKGPTDGLRFHYDAGSKWLAIDSAGSQDTVNMKDSSLKDVDHNQLFYQQEMKEEFYRSLVISMSDVVIMVVTDLTMVEQRLIKQFRQTYEDHTSGKRSKHLFVVSNMQTMTNKTYAEALFNHTIVWEQQGNIDLAHGNKLVFHARYGAHRGRLGQMEVTYIGFAKEHSEQDPSEAGQEYNVKNIKVLRDAMAGAVPRETKENSLSKLLQEAFTEWLPHFAEIAKAREGDGCGAVSVEYEPAKANFLIHPQSDGCTMRLRKLSGQDFGEDDHVPSKWLLEKRVWKACFSADEISDIHYKKCEDKEQGAIPKIFIQIPMPGVLESGINITHPHGGQFMVTITRTQDERFAKRTKQWLDKFDASVVEYSTSMKLPLWIGNITNNRNKAGKRLPDYYLRDGMLIVSARLSHP